MVNRTLIMRFFQNLIENSFKFCDPSRAIYVFVSVQEKDLNWVF